MLLRNIILYIDYNYFIGSNNIDYFINYKIIIVNNRT